MFLVMLKFLGIFGGIPEFLGIFGDIPKFLGILGA